MNKEAARPSVCTHTEPKTLVWTPQERNPNITPAPSTDTCGQCHSTDKREAGGRDRHYTSPCKTQWPKHPTASLNAQGTDADCAVQHPAADTRCVNAPSARTFPNTKTRFRPPEYMLAFAVSCGSAAQWGAPCLCRSSRIKKDAHTGVFFDGTILYPMCRCRYRTDLPCHRRMLARNVWSQRISVRI